MCVCVSVLSTFSNIFSSETTEPIETKFHVEPLLGGGTKVCPGHMRVYKKFLLTSIFCPLGDACPLPQDYIHVLNHEKKCIKSDFKEISLKLATNG